MQGLLGQNLGQYRIVEPIGVGGMATVFKAYQPALNRYVAIKVLPPLHAEQPGFAERFAREAQAIARLNHPNILPVYDSGQERGYSFIVMRYVEGACALSTMMKSPLLLEAIVNIIGQVAAALDHAHARQIIHRDVKPSNVLMDGDWALLADFGVAKMTEASVRLTGSGVGIGTPAYMSPEQGQGLPIDHRTDIYSLGIILFEMLTGQIPHSAETPMAIVLKRMTEPLPLPRSLNPRIPEAVERVVLKALAREPDGRFASAGEMAAALKQAAGPTAATTAPSLPHRPAPRPPAAKGIAWKWVGLLGLSAAGLALIGLLAVILFAALASIDGGLPTPAVIARPVTATPLPPAPARILFSDSLERADADRCNLGSLDMAQGGSGTHYYLPIWPSGGKDAANPVGASLVSGALQNNDGDYGGVQFTLAAQACSNAGMRGEDIGQDVNIRVDLLVPTDAAGRITQAGPYFRNRAAARGDGIAGGDSAGYWVQLHSTGEVVVKNLNPLGIVAYSGAPASFDNTAFHSLEIATRGGELQVALDGYVLTFKQGDELVTTLAIPATPGSNNGAAGIAFGAESSRGQVGGQRADNLLVSTFRSLASLPVQNNLVR